MRQNLTNIKEVNIEDVEHFYVVGSTTKEGLIEGRSNVKLDLKKVGSGGEGSSEDSALVKTLFGQTPYAVIMSEEQSSDPLPVITLEEALRTAGDDTTINIVYKEKEPKGKYSNVLLSGGYAPNSSFTGIEPSVMIQTPQGMIQGGPWYSLYPADVDLTGFTIPEVGGDPVVLTGVEIPDKDTIIIAFLYEGEPKNATLTKYDSEIFSGEGFSIHKENGVWMWNVLSS